MKYNPNGPFSDLEIHIAGKIRRYRMLRGYTLEQLAEFLDASRDTIYKIEQQKMKVNIRLLEAISETLDVPFKKFLPE